MANAYFISLLLTLYLCYSIIIHGMADPIDKIVKRRVVQQWLVGEAREKIIVDNSISAENCNQ